MSIRTNHNQRVGMSPVLQRAMRQRTMPQRFNQHPVVRHWPRHGDNARKPMTFSTAAPIGTLTDAQYATFWDRIVIITLRSRQDRLGRLQREIDGMKWPWQKPIVLTNIHGDQLGVPSGWTRGGGAWGCMSSHREVLLNAFRDGVKRLLVLEDDCTFVIDFAEKLRAWLTNVPSDWDQLMIGGQVMGDGQSPVQVAPGVMQDTQIERTHCYALQGDAIKSLWLFWNKVGLDAHCDWAMGDWQDQGYARCYRPVNFLAGQHEAVSDIKWKDGHGMLMPTRFWSNGEPDMEKGKPKVKNTSPWTMPAVHELVNKYGQGTKHFVHSGKYGDIIYALPAIKAAGGGVLWLDNWEPKTGMRMTPEAVEVIAPLLKKQEYIKDVRFVDGRPRKHEIDLNEWRKRNSGNLATDVLEILGLPFHHVDEIWLTVDPKPEWSNSVVINRSPRYRNDQFPWQHILEIVKNKVVFVGLCEEYDKFVKECGYASFIPTSNLYEAAQIIAACDLFIGNQSCLRAIAEGLKKPVIQEVWIESQCCLFKRQDEIDFRDDRDTERVLGYVKRNIESKSIPSATSVS